MIRISSMRLKLFDKSTGHGFDLATNDKNLKYEIETCTTAPAVAVFMRSTNDKNLKYEIETYRGADAIAPTLGNQ